MSKDTSWKWQLRHSVRTVPDLIKRLGLENGATHGLELAVRKFPLGITPYFLELLKNSEAVYKQMVPTVDELKLSEFDLHDPLGEERDEVIPGLIHRYPDRVLLLATDMCASYCRFCTRNRVVGSHEIPFNRARLEMAFDYIRSNPQIRDVILSGGDPLILNDEKFEWVLQGLRAIPTLEIIRLGTRIPVFLPQRITRKLVSILKRYHPIYMSVHVNHPDEITPLFEKAITRLADAGIVLGSQTVLLKGINDDAEVMRKLMLHLMRLRVRPYYIYQCDLSEGIEHFRTPLRVGIEIISKLRGFISGYACPNFVVDLPGGGGKVPLLPQYLLEQEGNRILFRNFEGKEYVYYEPEEEPVLERVQAAFR